MPLSLLILTVVAFAQDEVTIKGEVKFVDLKMKTLVVETYDRKDITITIDDGSLKKFEKGVIREGDGVTVECTVQNERLTSVSFFRKPRG
jgi:hypothetical protein